MLHIIHTSARISKTSTRLVDLICPVGPPGVLQYPVQHTGNPGAATPGNH